MRFNSLDDIRAFCRELPEGDGRFAEAAALRQQNLTKPPGSLGRLEELAIWLARWQRREQPRLRRGPHPGFGGKHGVGPRRVSPLPPRGTAEKGARFTPA